jgi:MYXO-CTERM domain-containing protein
MRTRSALLALVSTAALCPALALADGGEGDVFLELVNGELRTGLISEDGTDIDPGVRVFFAEFDTTTGTPFTDEPGVQSLPGGLGSATSFRFDILKALRVWNGSDFGTLAAPSITADLGPLSVQSPTTDVLTAGFSIALNPTGSHEHPDWTLSTPAAAGVYLLEVQWALSTGEVSQPTWMLWANNTDEATNDAAKDWATANIPSPSALGLLGVAGVVASRRRRAAR